jgi:hypothetical protein
VGEQALAVAGGVTNVNMPVVSFEFLDWDRSEIPQDVTKEDYRFGSCSGTLIDEHWILTASHCVPHYELTKAREADGRPPLLPDHERQFKALIYQKVKEPGANGAVRMTAITTPEKRAKCPGADAPRDTTCALLLTAYPYLKRDKSCKGGACKRHFDIGVGPADDVALLFINELNGISVNQYASGAAIEPEDVTLPLGFEHAPAHNELLVPWGWGKTGLLEQKDLRTAPLGMGVTPLDAAEAENKGILPEVIQIKALDGQTAVRVCRGDSGGPLVRPGPNGTRPAIVGVASKIIPASSPEGKALDCPGKGQPMGWSRVDTPEKKAWIEKTIGHDCRDSGAGWDCWQPRCDTQQCPGDATCRKRSRSSMTKQHELPDTIHVNRCVPKRRKK